MAYKSAIKTAVKKVFQAIEQGTKKDQVTESLDSAYSVIDRGVLKGILHKNTGARYKARLMKAVNDVK